MAAVLSSREQLLRTLLHHGPLSAVQLSALLEIGPSAVRQHLGRLRAEGWVEVADLQRGSGRPSQLFALTPQAERHFPDRYDQLLLDLVHTLDRFSQEDDLLRRVITAQRDIWQERYGHGLHAAGLEERLAALADILKEWGNEAEWSRQTDGTYRLVEHHCTIRRVAERYPDFCQEEQAWFQLALQAQVEQVDTRVGGDGHCTFRIVPQSGGSVGRGEIAEGKGE